jgi:hypothetical protein
MSGIIFFNKRFFIALGLVLLILVTSTFSTSAAVGPETTLLSYPVDLGNTRLAASTFTFSSSISGSTFECQLDSGGWGACTSPKNYPSLTPGSHTFEVRAIAPDLTPDSTPASHTWRVSPYFTWSREVVQNKQAENYSAIALDASGNPHILYSSSQGLTYAAWNPITLSWETTFFDLLQLRPGYEVSLALDANGYPQIVYYTRQYYTNENEFGLKYLYWDGSNWITETVEYGVWAHTEPYQDLTVGLFNSLVMDSLGNPHISYYNTNNGDPTVENYGLRHATRVGGIWQIEKVINGEGYGYYGTSIAMDSSDHPVIAFRSAPDQEVKLARYDGSTWAFETVDNLYDTGYYPSLVLDNLDHPHVSYLTMTTSPATSVYELDYAAWDGTTWNRQVVAERVTLVDQRMQLNAGGYPHIVYFDSDNSGLPMYTTWDGAQWHAEAIPTFSGSAPFQSSLGIDIDSAGHSHISLGFPIMTYYVDEKVQVGSLRATIGLAGTSRPTQASFQVCLSGGTIDLSGTTPNCQTVNGDGGTVVWHDLMPGSDYTISAPDVADWTEPVPQTNLAVTTGATTDINLTFTYTGADLPDTLITGRPLFDQMNTSNSASFKFESNQTDSTFECHLDSEAWAPCTVPQAYSSLSEGAHSFFVRAINARDGVDASPAQFDWTINRSSIYQLSESTAIGNSYISTVGLVLDQGGLPFIGASLDTQFVRVSQWNGDNWNTLAPGSGLFESLVFDSHGQLQITFFYNGWIYWGIWNGNRWDIQTVTGGGNSTLKLDANDIPHIIFVDQGYLKYVTRDFNDWRPDAWKINVGPFISYEDGHPVVIMDADGNFHISWSYSQNMFYLDLIDGVWGTIESVNTGHLLDSEASGRKSSIFLGADGVNYAAYCAVDTENTNSLYFATRTPAGWTSELAFTWSKTRSCEHPALVLDSEGHPHIASQNTNLNGDASGAIQETIWTGTRWVNQVYNQYTTHHDQDVALVLDTQGAPHIAFTDYVWNGSGYILAEAKVRGGIQVTKSISGSGYPTNASFEVCISGGSIGTTPECKTIVGNASTATWDSLVPGDDYVVTETDAGADWTEPVSQTVSVLEDQTTLVTVSNTFLDVTPPETTITAAPPIVARSGSASFSFVSNEANATFECSLDGASFAACISPAAYTSLGAGTHNFKVRAIDAVNLTDPSPATYTWKIDLSAGWTEVLGLGYQYTCALQLDGSLDCFGYFTDGQNLIDGDRPGPYQSIGVGDEHVCALTPAGQIECWGNNTFKQNNVPAGYTFTQVAGGAMHTCGLTTSGEAICWGADYGGGTIGPQAQDQVGPFSQISSGYYHNCAIKQSGEIQCWGDHSSTWSPGIPAPDPTNPFVQITSGYDFSCVVQEDGTLQCWGSNNHNQLSIPSGAFLEVNAGWYHACGLKTDGSVVCWGDNDQGQATAPAEYFTQVVAGTSHSCALKPDNSAVCWGLESGYGETQPGLGPYGLYVSAVNATPYVEAGPNQNANEGSLVNLNATFIDPDVGDTHTAQINWGDGNVEAGTVGSGTVTGSHTYTDNGSNTVTVTVTDSHSTSDSDTLTVTVANVAPTASFGNDGPVNEGSPVTVSFTSPSDVSTDDTAAGFHYAFACDNGSLGSATYAGSGTATSTTCTFTDNGSITVRGRIIDKDDGYTEYTTTVTVNNVAPDVDAGSDVSWNIATSYTLNATYTDPGTGDTHTATVDWGDGSPQWSGPVSGGVVNPSHTYTTTGSFTIVVTVTDDDGDSGTDNVKVMTISGNSFVILAQEGVWLNTGSKINSGDVGVNSSAINGPYCDGYQLCLDDNSQVVNASSRLLGNRLLVDTGASAHDVAYNSLTNNGTILGTQQTPLSLPLSAFPAVPSFTPGSLLITVQKGGSRVLTPGSYGQLAIGQNATITFLPGTYNFTKWSIGNNVKLYFKGVSEVRIQSSLIITGQAFLGPSPDATISSDDIRIYATGSTGTSNAIFIGTGGTVIANMYAPNGTLMLGQGVTATGAFYGYQVILGQNAQVSLEGGWSVASNQAPRNLFDVFLPMLRR